MEPTVVMETETLPFAGSTRGPQSRTVWERERERGGEGRGRGGEGEGRRESERERERFLWPDLHPGS